MLLKIALVGNPNSGKTTLFNELTGSNQYVGNWPGVTVEKKEGKLIGNKDVVITDLPGIYSLSPYTPEEIVARNYLVNEKPDAVLNIVDGTNLERNLYLTTQILELGIPVVIAINMMDLVKKNKDEIDIELLSKNIGCKIVEISALKGEGIDKAVEDVIKASNSRAVDCCHTYSGPVEHSLAHIEEAALHNIKGNKQRWYAIKIFEKDEKVISELNLDKAVLDHINEDISFTEKELDDDSEAIIINERYNFIGKILRSSYKRRNSRASITDKIDKIVTNRILALPIFVAVMFLVYFVAVTSIGSTATDFMNDGVFGEGWSFFGIWVESIPNLVNGVLESINAPQWLTGLIVDGIVGGVGAVLGFVPQMFILFFMLSFLEACGYMSRIAFIMDKLFRKFGLSGKSFIPILVGTGCSVPGIMASRTIENERDRRITIITTSFMPCGAKLPIISMIAVAMFGGDWWVGPSAYFAGIAAIVISGIVLKKTKSFASNPSPFVMELPAYHLPTLRNLLISTWDRGWSFVKKAGTVILFASVIIWAGSVFGVENGAFVFNPEMDIDNSILGIVGNGISFIFIPLGFGHGKAAIATIMGLVAKEEVVGVFGVLGFEDLSALAAYSFLIFNLLCAPCFAAIGAIKREMNSAKWTFFAIAYQTLFAYGTSLIIYQLGRFIANGIFGIWTVVAIALLIGLLYMMFRKNKHLDSENKIGNVKYV